MPGSPATTPTHPRSTVAPTNAARRARAAAVLVLLAGVVAGCTGDPSPSSSSPSPTPSPGTTPTPAATSRPSPSEPPTRPDAMNRDDVQGAIAAAQYFLELYPYAYNTGDLTEWREMSHPECIFCASVIENVEALHARGGYEVGGEFVFETVSARDPLPDNEYFAVDFEVIQKEISEMDGNGSLAKSTPEAEFSIFTAVLRNADRWMIRAVSTEEAQ